MPGIKLENVADVVRYHKPTDGQIVKHEKLAQAAENFMRVIIEECPPCADTSDALRSVRNAKMTASAAVALNGLV